MWLDGKRVEQGIVSVGSRCVAMDFNLYERTDTYAGTPPAKFVRLVISRAASKRNKLGGHTRKLGLRDVEVAFWHAELPEGVDYTVVPPRSEEADGMGWQLRKAMYGARIASNLFSEFRMEVFLKALYTPLSCSRQVY